MRQFQIAHFTDWMATSLRWVVLLGISLSLSAGGGLGLLLILTLSLGALWNAILTLLAGMNRRIAGHNYVNIVGDALLAYLLFYLSGGLESAIPWVGFMPLISAAIYFELRGALLAALVNLLAQAGIAVIGQPVEGVLLMTAMLASLYFGLGLIFSFLNGRIQHLVKKYQLDERTERQQEEAAERERRHAIYHLILTLGSSLNLQRVLDTSLDSSARALTMIDAPADRLISAVLLFGGGNGRAAELRVGAARGFSSADTRLTLPGHSGLLGTVIEEGAPHLTNDVKGDPELKRVLALGSCQSAYCLPLRTGLDTYGVLLFAHPDPDFFVPAHCEVLDITASQVTNAIQNARLYQDLELEKERMMEIQEEARKKMARDLHDGPTQSVAAIAMRVNFARKLIERDPVATAEELLKIEDLARRTTQEIRHMLFTLRPLVLESQGLIAALESMAEKTRETYGQNVIIQADRQLEEEMEMSRQAVVFYIAEEAVNNARKHAQAETVWVRLRPVKKDLALLEIEDNGVGFDLQAVDSSYENRGSLGMVNMRERAELVNGLIHIETAPGQGTRIQVAIPLTEQAAEQLRHAM